MKEEQSAQTYKNIDEYIALFPGDVQEKLTQMRHIILDTEPTLQEKISWQMPTFYLEGNVVHFAAHTRHIGFYPGASGVENFLAQLEGYKTSKGCIQFPLKDALPTALIREIVAFRVEENKRLAANKKKKA